MRRFCGVSITLPAVRVLVVLALLALILFVAFPSILLSEPKTSQVSAGADVSRQQQQAVHSAPDSSLFVGDPEQRKQECRCEKECKRCLKRAYAIRHMSRDNDWEQQSEDETHAADLATSSEVVSVADATEKCEKAKMSVNGEYTQSVYVLKKRTGGAGGKEGTSPKNKKVDILWPFTFIKKYCDIPGAIQREGAGRYVFDHSHGRLYHPTVNTPYRPTGPYITFANSSVETRGQVQCIDGVESLPRSQRDDRINSYF